MFFVFRDFHDSLKFPCFVMGVQFILCFICIGMITFEVMLAHMFTQMLIVVVQDALLLVFTLIVFGVSMVQNRV